MKTVNLIRSLFYSSLVCADLGSIYYFPTIGNALQSSAFVFAIVGFIEMMIALDRSYDKK
jgi:hypothetical protein